MPNSHKTTPKVEFTTSEYFKIFVLPLFFVPFFIALSGDWSWFEGWCLMLLWNIGGITTNLYLYVYDPVLLKERQKITDDSADKWVHKILLALAGSIMIIIPLDSKRYKWSEPIIASIPFFTGIKWIAFLALLAGLFFSFGSFVQNTFLAPVLRIQSERKQKVISHGLYGVVRHPMYTGVILIGGGAAIFCESILGMIWTIGIVIVLILRTDAEEKMLIKGLEGYAKYMDKVRYRFFPMIY